MSLKQAYEPMSAEALANIKEGDILERMLAFAIPMPIIVQSVNETVIDAGWIFDRQTGLEIDEDIPTKVSYIRRVLTVEEADARD